MTTRDPVLPALALGLLLTWSAPALALPGPETLGPMAAAGAPLLGLLGWVLARLVAGRRRKAWLVVVVGAVATGLLFGTTAGVLVLCVALALGRRQVAWLTPGAVLLLLGLLGPRRPALPTLAALPADPRDAQAVQAPDGRRTVVVHVGEDEVLDNCRVAGGYLLRPADLVDIDPAWREAEALWLVTERVDGPAWLDARPAAELLRSRNPGVICFHPPLRDLWAAVVPRGELVRGVAGARAGAALRRVPWRSAATPLPGATRSVRQVLSCPTEALASCVEDGEILVGEDLARLAAAVRLAQQAGVAPAGASWRPRGLVQPSVGVLGFLVALGGGVAWVLAWRRRFDPALMRWRVGRARAGRAPPPWAATLSLLGPLALPLGLALLLPGRLRSEGLVAGLLRPVAAGAPWPLLAAGVVLGIGLVAFRSRTTTPGAALASVVLLTALLAGTGAAWAWAPTGAALVLLLPALLVWALPPRGAVRPLDGLASRRDAGGKIAGLVAAHRRGVAVPPGVVVDGDSVAPVLPWLGPGPLLVRSSAADEDQRSGHYPTRIADQHSLVQVVAEVRRALPTRGSAALVMPCLPAQASGVAQCRPGRVLLERGAGRDGVATSGGTPTGRALVGAWSDRVRGQGVPEALARVVAGQARRALGGVDGVVEWVEVGDQPWIVQAMATAEAEDWRSRAAGVVARGGRMVRVDGTGLPLPAGPRTLALWAGQWTRDGALGQAAGVLGLPRVLVPQHLLHGMGGVLYVDELAAARVGLLVQARRGLPGSPPEVLARRLLDTGPDLQDLAAASIGLRLLDPLLPEGRAPEAWGPPPSLVRPPPSDGLAPGLAGRDFEPAALPPLPQCLSRGAAAWLRDALHGHLVVACAALGRADATWVEDGALALAEVPPHTIDRAVVEGGAPPPPGAGVWVSGAGPIEGVVSRQPGPDAICILERPDPAAITEGWAAVVARTGGVLSHGALVARARGVPALFGVGPVPLLEGQRVQLTKAGGLVAI